MKGLMVLRCFIGVFILLNAPVLVNGENGKPILHIRNCLAGMPDNQADTIPASVKSSDNAVAAKPAEEIIKTVPKVRKQAVPIPVVVPVNPIKIVKPKIVKPVIKVRL